MKITSHLRYYKIHDLSILFYSQWKSKCSNCSKKIQTLNCFEKIFFKNPFNRRKKVNKYSLSFKAFLLYGWALLCQNKPVLFKILSTFRMQSQPLILPHCWGINIENHPFCKWKLRYYTFSFPVDKAILEKHFLEGKTFDNCYKEDRLFYINYEDFEGYIAKASNEVSILTLVSTVLTL